MDIVNVEDLALDFTVPGYDIELRVSFITSSVPVDRNSFHVIKAWWTRYSCDFGQCRRIYSRGLRRNYWRWRSATG